MKQSEWFNELKTNFYLIQEYNNAGIARSLEVNLLRDKEVDGEFLQKVSDIFEHGKVHIDIHPKSGLVEHNEIYEFISSEISSYNRNAIIENILE